MRYEDYPCVTCHRKNSIQDHLDAHQFEAVTEIIKKFCTNCLKHPYHNKPYNYYQKSTILEEVKT